MTKRRELLQMGLGASVSSFLPLFMHSAEAAETTGIDSTHILAAVLYDLRQPASQQQARMLARRLTNSRTETRLHGLQGDVGAFWYHELDQLWSSGQRGLAGSTAPDMLFCLQQLARDHRQRLVWHEQSDTQLVSWVIA